MDRSPVGYLSARQEAGERVHILAASCRGGGGAAAQFRSVGTAPLALTLRQAQGKRELSDAPRAPLVAPPETPRTRAGWVGGPAWDGPALRRPRSLTRGPDRIRPGDGAACTEGRRTSVRAGTLDQRCRAGGRTTSRRRHAKCSGGRTGDVVLGALRSVGRRRSGPPSWRDRWRGLEASRASRPSLRSLDRAGARSRRRSALRVEASAAADPGTIGRRFGCRRVGARRMPTTTRS